MDSGAPLHRPERPLGQRLLDLLVWGTVAILLALAFKPVEMENARRLIPFSANAQHFVAGFAQPDFSLWRDYVAQMWLTLQMALWGTALAIVIAIPLGFAGARNIAPWWVQQPVRRLMDLLRAVPDLVVGLIFVIAVGLGPFAGVMALAVNTGGVLGKLFSEAVESIDPQPVEGVRAVGATRLQEIVWGVAPQVAPLWTSYALYRVESNARAATILGLIGAGGIGQRLYETINAFEFRQTAAIVIVIIVAVSLIDLMSQALRQRLL
jgi:phosphonate transport system permease protein